MSICFFFFAAHTIFRVRAVSSNESVTPSSSSSSPRRLLAPIDQETRHSETVASLHFEVALISYMSEFEKKKNK